MLSAMKKENVEQGKGIRNAEGNRQGAVSIGSRGAASSQFHTF